MLLHLLLCYLLNLLLRLLQLLLSLLPLPTLATLSPVRFEQSILRCLASILDNAHPRVLSEGHSPSAVVQAVLPAHQGGLR